MSEELNDTGFSDYWSRVLEVHDYASDPNDVEHFYDYKGAFEAGVPIPGPGEHWPSAFKHDLHPDRYIKGEDIGKPDIDYWDTKSVSYTHLTLPTTPYV